MRRGAGYAFSIYQTPIYQASTRLEVSPGEDNSPLVSYNDILLNERLTSTYAHKLTARPVLIKAFESVVEDVEKNMDLADISVQPLRDTQLIDLQIQHPSPLRSSSYCQYVTPGVYHIQQRPAIRAFSRVEVGFGDRISIDQ